MWEIVDFVLYVYAKIKLTRKCWFVLYKVLATVQFLENIFFSRQEIEEYYYRQVFYCSDMTIADKFIFLRLNSWGKIKYILIKSDHGKK